MPLCATVSGKNEVALEFEADDTINPEHDTLTEMRIWVPEDENGQFVHHVHT